jgi:D-alanine-D-alanine ligase
LVINYKGEIVGVTNHRVVSENDFFDYEAKYQGSHKNYAARISDEMTQGKP